MIFTRVVKQLRDGRGDDGFTMAEMVVTLFLFGLISSVMTVFVSGALRTTRHTNSQQYDLINARNAMDAMTRSLRSAVDVATSPATPAFYSANATSVTFFAANGTGTGAVTSSGPSKITYTFDTTAKTLVEQTTPATATASSTVPYTWNSTDTRTRVIASGLPNPQPSRPDISGAQTSGGPIFSYFDYAGATIPVDSTGAVTSAGLPLIQQVEVWLTLRSGTAAESGPTSVVAKVDIVAGYDPDGGTT